MYCLSNDGCKLVNANNLYIGKGQIDEGTKQFYIYANDKIMMATFDTLEEARNSLKDISTCIRAGRCQYEF